MSRIAVAGAATLLMARAALAGDTPVVPAVIIPPCMTVWAIVSATCLM